MTSSDLSLRAAKIWEGNGPVLVLQTQAFGAAVPEGVKRLYLVVDANQRSLGVRAALDKPEDLKPRGAVVALARKHVPSGGVGRILRDPVSGDWWVPLFTQKGGEPDFYLHVAAGSPPELRLVTRAKDVLVRKSSQGSYTKRRTHEGELPYAGDAPRAELEDKTPQLLSELDALVRAAAAPEAAEEAKAPAPEAEATPLSDFQREARDRLARKLKTVRKSVEKQAAETPDHERLARAEADAALLKAHLYRVREGMHELAVQGDGLEDERTLELDPDLSPGANLERAYQQVKKLRRAVEIGARRLAEGKADVTAMDEDLQRLRGGPLPESDVTRILARWRLPLVKPEGGPRAEGPTARPWKSYVYAPSGEPPVELLVGKSAADNDELCKQARSNDWWLHAVGVTGSHVIIPSRQLKAEPSLALLRVAAVLALHYSRLKDDLAGEVYVTKRQYLRKRKGMPPGLWQIDQAETMFVRYDEAELRQALELLKA